jgi:MFS family permease
MTAVETHEPTRRRLIGTLFTGNAISSTAYIGIATVAALVAEDITGSTSLSGLAATTGTLGVAAGAAALSWMSLKAGRRPTFTLGYILATVGSIIALVSIPTGSFLLLLVGMAAMGFGRSVGQLARYAAGDLRSAEHRARAISLIVWASTIGAVLGPLLIGPTSAFGVAAGANEYAGPVLVAAIGFTLAAVLMAVGIRPDPLTLAVTDGTEDDTSTEAAPISELVKSRTVQLSIAAIVVSQAVMVLVMVMTPLHIRDNDGGLSTVGWVMMAHTLGMFAIAPVTGRLVDMLGARRIITAAVGTFIVACVIAASAATASTPALIVGLFLLGVAWNFGFVSGSTLLQEGQNVPNRLKLQGFADSSAWVTSALAAAASGVIMSNTSYSSLGLLGAALALLPLALMHKERASAIG